MHPKLREILFITSLSCVLLTGQADAQKPFWSVGPKLGGTLGVNGGFTWGFEASYFPKPSFPLWGFTADLTFWKSCISFHIGIEGNEMIGVDAGPTFFYSDQSIQAGVSLIPFVGILLIAYYELAWPFFQTPFQTFGGYMKIPVGVKVLPKGSAF